MTGMEGALSPSTDPSPHFRKMGEAKSPHPISRSGETEAEDKDKLHGDLSRLCALWDFDEFLSHGCVSVRECVQV